MNRVPLPDQLPYQFQSPRVSPFWVSTSRLAVVRLGEPINVGARLSPGGGRSPGLASTLTAEMEERIQSLPNQIGPGRPLPEFMTTPATSPGPVDVSIP
jgi:hypothetical protein